MSGTTNAYLICGIECDGEMTNESVRTALGSLQHTVELCILEGYRPVGGVTLIVTHQGFHVTQPVFREPSRIVGAH